MENLLFWLNIQQMTIQSVILLYAACQTIDKYWEIFTTYSNIGDCFVANFLKYSKLCLLPVPYCQIYRNDQKQLKAGFFQALRTKRWFWIKLIRLVYQGGPYTYQLTLGCHFLRPPTPCWKSAFLLPLQKFFKKSHDF